MANKKILNFAARPLSWSAISSFEWSKDEWYAKYVLGIPTDENPAMAFGKAFAKSCENRAPMAPVTLLAEMEKKFSVVFNKIPLIGFADTFCPDTPAIGEYKTGEKPWTQKKVDEHGQLTMYALMWNVSTKRDPGELRFFLEYVPTEHRNDFSVRVKPGSKPLRFDTRRTMADVLRFAARINRTVAEMEAYAQARAGGAAAPKLSPARRGGRSYGSIQLAGRLAGGGGGRVSRSTGTPRKATADPPSPLANRPREGFPVFGRLPLPRRAHQTGRPDIQADNEKTHGR